MKNKINIFLASPRGFCAGVDRAIEIVKKSIKKYGTPVYVRHEIVHNKHVVDELKKLGACFVEELSEIKDTSRPVIFSAHGVPKSVPEDAEFKNIEYIDATCPLVTKVHRESENLFKNDYHIILIGHSNHPEVIGTMGQLPKGAIDLIETIEDAKKYNFDAKNKKISFITQTTLSLDDTAEIITNRQLAVKKIAPLCDMFFVIGSENSSNSLRLVEIAKKSGCVKSKLISLNQKIPINEIKKSQNIGISSGASAPEILVKNLINEIKKISEIKIKEVEYTKENVTFKIPNKLQ